MSPAGPPPTAVLFDLGGVVLRWEPERAYQQVLPADEVRAFMTAIDFAAWNRAHDGGQPFATGEAALLQRFPEQAAAIRAYREHFPAAIPGMVPGTSAVIAELAQAGVRQVGLTNWSAETFPWAQQEYGILRRFAGVVVSGAERLLKPDPAIFRLACRRFGLDPAATVFVDDSPANVAAAARVGLAALPFTDATVLRSDLVELGLLGPRAAPAGPVYHLAVRSDWAEAERTGQYPWSTRAVGYHAEGYVHCSLAHQVAGVRNRFYADLPDEELLLLELGPDAGPIVLENLQPGGAGEEFPHLYAALAPTGVRAVHRPAALTGG